MSHCLYGQFVGEVNGCFHGMYNMPMNTTTHLANPPRKYQVVLGNE